MRTHLLLVAVVLTLAAPGRAAGPAAGGVDAAAALRRRLEACAIPKDA